MGRDGKHARNYVTYQVTLCPDEESGLIRGDWLRFGDLYGPTTLQSEVSLSDLLESGLLAAGKKRVAEQQMEGGPRRISQMGSLAKMELERLDTAIQEHEFEIAVTDVEHQIPSNRPKDHHSCKLPPLEGLILRHLTRLSPFRHGTACTWCRPQRKAATEPRNLLNLPAKAC